MGKIFDVLFVIYGISFLRVVLSYIEYSHLRKDLTYEKFMIIMF